MAVPSGPPKAAPSRGSGAGEAALPVAGMMVATSAAASRAVGPSIGSVYQIGRPPRLYLRVICMAGPAAGGLTGGMAYPRFSGLTAMDFKT